jgi:hypothetical protein
MSTRDLFERSTNYVSDTDQKDAFSDAESSKNVQQIIEKQNSFEPQIDYSDPQTFAKYGSAEMYYKSAIDRILDFYPYDGSDAEYNNFYNKSLDIEKYIFNNLYPRTNGYVDFAGSSYISLKGGPHTIAASNTKGLFKDPQSSQRETANIYDEDLYTTEGLPSDYGQGTRESNLLCDFTRGVTVEFWLSSSAISSEDKQAIFHITGSGQDDELTIFLSGTTGSPFHVRLKEDGTTILNDEQIGTTPTTSSILGWSHYALSFKSASAGISSRLYVNGALDTQTTLGSTGAGEFEQSGSLGYVASGSATETLLNGAMDEFRFWKVERTAQEIGRNWFGQVRGGSNTDISNTTLGVYYKFNEGITGVTAQDSVVLDYSGRVSNGTFTGYTSTTRNTGSAIVLAGAAASEYRDPIIYANHPDVSSLRTGLIQTGSIYDSNNNASIGSMMPSWVIEEHEETQNDNFTYLMHIVGAYFDKIRLQIAALPDFKTPVYTSSSFKALPFAEHLPASLGLETPQLFVDADVLERFLNRNETQNYEFDLNDTKNLIYLNLYNNLTYLFKSKGTHKAVRNVLRAFNIDDKLVRFNTYANNFVYDLQNNLRQTTVYDAFANFNHKDNLGAVVYSTASADSTQLGYISSSNDNKYEDRYGFTLETDVTFPKFIRSIDTFDRNFITASLFGIHSASADSASTEIFDPSIYVFAEREEAYSKNIRFRLSSSLLSTTLTSSNFLGAYNDQPWNLSVRLRPDTFGITGSVEGVVTSNYILEFTGYNQLLGEIRESFTVTGSVVNADAQSLLSSPKRLYVGAQRENVTGSLINKSDVLVSAVRYWSKNLDDETLRQHAYDFENYGIKDSNKHLSPLDADNAKTLNSHTLVLNYDFSGITTSDGSGEFVVNDISSGSVENRIKFGKLGEISSYLYPAKGVNFGASSTKAVIKKELNLHQFIDPEKVINDNLVQVRTEDDKLFDTLDTIPNYHYLLEKSMYGAISEEMLNFFAGVVDFQNLIGHPVNQYRMEYKELSKLREVFFRRVTEVAEVEKFVDYYKWFDDSVSQIIDQLVPASADYTADILNTVESHVLERNKYQHRIPMMAFTSSTEGVAFGAEELRYNWDRNHAPVSGLERDNSNWWKERAEREGTISSGDAVVDADRTQIRNVTTNQTNGGVGRSFTNAGVKYSRSSFKYRTLSKGQVFETKRAREIRGGVNFTDDKDIHYTYTALHPAGPVNQDNDVFVPKNVLLGFTDDLVALEDTSDPPENPAAKVKRNILVQHGRDWEDGIGYKNVKSSKAFPFNIVSSSVRSGYNAHVIARATASIEITNLHNDVYGPDMERPMQGPFTNYAVGGHQSRHIKLNTGTDNYLNRPEAWKIALGKCPNTDGAIGMVGADYPYPEANEEGESPYPLTGAQKATYFRDETAKRPVNIRNIQHRTGSTILGNYNANYDVVHTVGGYSNPRAFIDEQPTLPTVAEGADVVKTILDIERGRNGHFTFVDDYNAGYLTGSGDYKNKTVIVSRFSSPGSTETSAPAFKDFRSGDFSVYNTINNRNWTSRRPFQGVTSSIVSQTTGYRSFDHTGKDFGFTNLAARHATRFFRDSTLVADVDYANVPRNSVTTASGPGNADDAFSESPSFHKVHRNNVLKPREVISTVQVPSDLNLTNSEALYFLNWVTGQSAVARKEAQVLNYLTGSRASGSTFSGWVRIDNTKTAAMNLFTVGRTPAADGPFIRFYKGSGNYLYLDVKVDSGGIQTNQWRAENTTFNDGDFHHIAISFDTSLTASTTNFYVDGVKQTTLEVNRYSSNFWTTPDTSYDFRGFGLVNSTRYYVIGNDSNNTTDSNQLTGAIDQVSVWTTQLTDAEIQSLYNSGNPYNITASSVYTNNSSDLHAWWTFERGPDAIDTTNPGTFNSSTNAFYDYSGNDYDLFSIARSGQTIQLALDDGGTYSPAPVEGDTSTTPVEVTSYVCDQKYDNLNLHHQIPRSDRQYSWIGASVTHTGACEPRYSGFMQVNSPLAPYYEITGNYYPFFDYVSASAATSGIYQNTTRLGLLVLDKTGSATNTLGESTISGALQTPAEGERLNALLIRRGDTYGWNWRAFHQKDHPILNREHKENLLTALKSKEIREFRLPPVSMKGKPVMVNMDVGGENVTLKATHNNEKIYFNERELNDLVFQTQDQTITPFDQLIDVSQNYNLNWVRYSETLFPSTRNEFSSGSRERLGFDNGFWRDSRSERTTLGSTDAGDGLGYNSFAIKVSQSSWVLDAPEDFINRTSVLTASMVGGGGTYAPDRIIYLSGTAGELQNEYLFAPIKPSSILAGQKVRPSALAIASIYSRKQNLTSPNSVASPSGFAKIEAPANSFTDEIPNYAGEALWEAGTHATINIKSGSSFITSSYASEPWFDEYGDFREDLQLVARDYAIIPEFRISEHINEYVKGGTFNKSNFDTFEIPGTTISSSQQNFYKDYSNSDFLREFASIKDKSGLSAKEIMLTCKAAVRFNPYKGFYPAQRTIDLVSQFSSSFAAGISYTAFSDNDPFGFTTGNSQARPLIQPLFAPGILYNSIKSGIAVDYPVVNRSSKISSQNFSGSGTGENWCLQPSATIGNDALHGIPSTTNGYTPAFQYWDFRVPFETMVEPGKYIDKVQFLDFEPNPSASLSLTASLDASVSDGIYELMAKNFFGQTGDFFLNNSSYTKIESDLIQDGLKFKNGDVFAARLKIRKSHNGKRFYSDEYGFDGTQDYFTTNGAQAYSGSLSGFSEISGGSYPLPQDPARNTDFQETFTMYSRPTAFGPAIAGRPTGSYETAHLNGTMDSLEGYNWAYTPPYYHGESWVDFIFRPDATKTYTLEDVLTETEAVYWRVDPGAPTGSIEVTSPQSYVNNNLLMQNGRVVSGSTHEIMPIYGGSVVNKNAMQLDSSLNLFGVERVPKKRKDKFGNTILDQNELAGKRWVIQPKWETPMLNFVNVKEDNNNITYPTNFSESVPRGMWHQFGEMPTDPDTGVFLEIGDIPNDWLKYHYEVINQDSVYNNNDFAGSGSTAYLDYQSLSDLFGFSRSQKKDSAKVRLGEIADKREVYEAVVAIPYIVEANEDYSGDQKKDAIDRKKFISIPKQRFDSALKEREGSQDGDSLETAGESIRKMVQKMKRYVMPPQFDFINFDQIDPIVMYFFEFKYEFDKDDLSYIWQNLAPRDYKKITFQEASVAHDLMNTELLEEQNIIDNPNLRWMVFKVKQKATKDYYDLIPPQVKAARPTTNLDKAETDKDDEYLQFNWPYDYLSFVELVKLEADVLYKADEEETE